MARSNFTVALPGSVDWNDSTLGHVTRVTNSAQFSQETCSGVSRRKPKGWIPPTNYSFEKYEYKRAFGRHEVYVVPSNWTDAYGWLDATGMNTLNYFNSACSDATARATMSSSGALVGARAKLKDGRVNLAVAFAERNQTAMLLGDTATRLAKAARDLRRGQFRNAARRLGILTDPGRPRGSNWINHWMQLQYGWKPLLSDIYGACSALSKRPREDWLVHVTSQRNDSDSWSLTGTIGGTQYPTSGFYAANGRAVRKRGVFVRIDAIPDNDLIMSFTSLGLTNPLLVAWEIMPYSFVVDWVVPIGDWLNSLDAHLGFSTSYTSTSYWNETTWQINGVSRRDFTDPKAKCINDWTASKRLLQVKRVASSGIPQATFPGIKDPRSLGHMANGLSLLAQAFGR